MTASEAPYVLHGLHLQTHRTSLRIAEHYTDTASATDHVFGALVPFAPQPPRSDQSRDRRAVIHLLARTAAMIRRRLASPTSAPTRTQVPSGSVISTVAS